MKKTREDKVNKAIRVLIVSYFFYPCNLVGARRPTYVAKMLSRNGFKVSVLKANNKHYQDNIEFYTDGILGVPAESVSVKNTRIGKVFVWAQKYALAIHTMLRKEDIDLIYYCGGPFFTFWFASILKVWFNTKYVLDFRDLWALETIGNTGLARAKSFLSKRIESSVVRNASLIIHVTHEESEIYRKRYSKKTKAKFVTICNGYDDDLLATADLDRAHRRLNNRLKIGIFGKFSYYRQEDVGTLLSAIDEVSKNIAVEVVHLGVKERFFEESVVNSTQRYNISFHGYVSYIRGLQELSECDCLLLNNRSTLALGTKIFDYIYLNKPIVAIISPVSAIAKLLANFRNSFVVSSSGSLAFALREILQRNITTLDDQPHIAKYSRKEQMQKVVPYLKEIVIGKGVSKTYAS